jgi:hypothetical protein
MGRITKIVERMRQRAATAQRGTPDQLNDIEDLYKAIADEIITLISSIKTHKDAFVLYTKLSRDAAAKMGVGPPRTVLAALVARIESFDKELASVRTLSHLISPYAEGLPEMASSMSTNLRAMEAILLNPETAANEDSVTFLNLFKTLILGPLAIGIQVNQAMLMRQGVAGARRAAIERPVEAALRAA